MNKALVRPHLDYYDVIYHIPSKQDQLGVVLNSLMGTAVKVQFTKQYLLLLVHGKVQELGWESLSDRR